MSVSTYNVSHDVPDVISAVQRLRALCEFVLSRHWSKFISFIHSFIYLLNKAIKNDLFDFIDLFQTQRSTEKETNKQTDREREREKLNKNTNSHNLQRLHVSKTKNNINQCIRTVGAIISAGRTDENSIISARHTYTNSIISAPALIKTATLSLSYNLNPNPNLVILQFNTSYSTVVEFARLFI